MPIRTKLLLVFLLLSLGPLALVGFLAYDSGRRALEDSLGTVFELRAARAIETLDREAEAARRNGEHWTELELMQDALTNDPDGRLSAFLISSTRGAELVNLALVADPEGRVVAASRPEWLGRPVATLARASLKRTGCIDDTLGTDPARLPHLTCRFPLRAAFEAEQVIGHLYVTLDLGSTVARLQSQGRKDATPVEVLVARGDGRLMLPIPSEAGRSLAAPLAASASGAALLAAEGRSGFLVESIGGSDHLVGYAHSSGTTGWSVVVGQDTDVAFTPAHRLGLVVLGLATVLAVLVFALSFILARRITSPILDLTRAAQRVAVGDLEPPLPTRPEDEIGALTDGFAHMVGELRAQRAQLVEKDYLDSIVSHMVDGLIVVNDEGMVLTTNPALQKLAGRAADDLAGHTATALFAEAENAFRERVLVPVRRDGSVRAVELGLLTAAGHTVLVSLSAGTLPRGPAGSGAIVCILTDITQIKRSEAALVRAREDAEAAARAKARFLATMSHEIRTPLNGIIGMMELLVGSELGPRQRDYAETAQRSGEALLAIIGDILDYSKLDAGRLELESLVFDPRATVEGIADTLAPRAREKDLELTVACDPGLPARVSGDERRLRQVLLNIAVKFTSRGHVILRAAPDPRRLSGILFEVADTGIGIPEEGRQRLFRPFSQVDASTTRQFGGTGLGLAISGQLVELMGGEIGVESDAGRGSTFWVSVPLPTVEAAPPEAATPRLSALRVLVVDDNETNRHVVCEMLERWDCRPTEAADAWEALQQLRDAADRGATFDLALVDYQMPEMDGAQLAAEIRKDGRLEGLPLALLTSVPQHAETARQMGFAVCLTKPLKAAALRQAVEATVGASAGNSSKPSVSLAGPPGSSPRRRGRVLVVDDDATSRKVATELLERSGCACDAVPSAAAALEALDRRTYELVLMDCHMPAMDGYEATRRIREEHDRQERVVIVAMTGAAFEEDRARCLAAGMDDHVAKPIRTADVERILDRYLPARG